MQCPKCGHVQEDAPECKRCGIIIAKYRGPKSERKKVTPEEPESLGDSVPSNFGEHGEQGNPLLCFLGKFGQWSSRYRFHWPSVTIGLALGLSAGIAIMVVYSQSPLLPEEQIVRYYRNANKKLESCLDSMQGRIEKEWEKNLGIKGKVVDVEDLPPGRYVPYEPLTRQEMLLELPAEVRAKICAKEREAAEVAGQAFNLFVRGRLRNNP